MIQKIGKIEKGVFGSDSHQGSVCMLTDALAFLPLLEILPGAQIFQTFLNGKTCS